MIDLGLFAATVVIWGTTWLAIAFQLGPVPVLTSIFYRFALAAVLLLPVLAMTGRLTPIRRRDHLFVALQGLFLFSTNFVCFYNATRFIPSGLVSVVFSLATLFNAVNARLIFGEVIAPRTVVAAVLGGWWCSSPRRSATAGSVPMLRSASPWRRSAPSPSRSATWCRGATRRPASRR